MSLEQVAFHYGIASSAAGIISLLVVGRVDDRLARRDPRWLLRLVVVMIVVLMPFAVLGFVVGNATVASVCVAAAYVVGTAYMAPSIAAMQRLVAADERAMASAVFLFFSAIAGSSGPFLAGLISDGMSAALGDMSLGRALLLVVPTFQILAIVFFVLAGRRFDAAIIEDNEGQMPIRSASSPR